MTGRLWCLGDSGRRPVHPHMRQQLNRRHLGEDDSSCCCCCGGGGYDDDGAVVVADSTSELPDGFAYLVSARLVSVGSIWLVVEAAAAAVVE